MVQVLVMFFWCKYYCCSYDASIDNAFMILVQFIPLCAFSKNKCTYNHKHPSIVEWHIQKLFNNIFHGMRKMLVVHPFKGEWNKTQHLFAICDFLKQFLHSVVLSDLYNAHTMKHSHTQYAAKPSTVDRTLVCKNFETSNFP